LSLRKSTFAARTIDCSRAADDVWHLERGANALTIATCAAAGWASPAGLFVQSLIAPFCDDIEHGAVDLIRACLKAVTAANRQVSPRECRRVR
jgi:hypothetical protein